MTEYKVVITREVTVFAKNVKQAKLTVCNNYGDQLINAHFTVKPKTGLLCRAAKGGSFVIGCRQRVSEKP